MDNYIDIPYGFDYVINLNNDKQWYVTQEDIRKNTIEGLLDFVVNPKTLAERMLEDSEEYGKWLDAQKPESNSFSMRQSLN